MKLDHLDLSFNQQIDANEAYSYDEFVYRTFKGYLTDGKSATPVAGVIEVEGSGSNGRWNVDGVGSGIEIISLSELEHLIKVHNENDEYRTEYFRGCS